MKPVTEYLDYQQYLRDFYQRKKEQFSFFSYRFMGRRLSMDPGTLFKVLHGQAHLSLKSLVKVSEFCELNKKESEYFEIMVRYGKSKTTRETKLYFEKLLKMQGVHSREVEKKQYALYQKWYHTAIWALLGYYKFSGDYMALAKKLSPSISAKQAKESIHLLKDLGFIRKNNDGYYEFTTEKITTGEKWHSAAIHSFQKETIKMASESLERHDKEIRDISTVTVALNHSDLEEIKERAKEFRKSILQLETKKENLDIVFQINVQVVPLTEIGKD